MKVYALLDKKKSQFDGALMLAHADGHMGRTLVEAFKGTGHVVEKYPADFDVYQVAEFDLDSGQCNGAPKFVCNVAVLFDGGINA